MKLLTIISFTLFLALTLAGCNDNNENINDSATTEKSFDNNEENGENLSNDEINTDADSDDNYDDGEIIEGEIDEEDTGEINELDDFYGLDEKQELLLLPGDEAYEKFPTD